MTYSFSLSLNRSQRQVLSALFIDLAKAHFTVGVGSPVLISAHPLIKLTLLTLAVIVGFIYIYLSLKLLERT